MAPGLRAFWEGEGVRMGPYGRGVRVDVIGGAAIVELGD